MVRTMSLSLFRLFVQEVVKGKEVVVNKGPLHFIHTHGLADLSTIRKQSIASFGLDLAH